ncbi:MAG: pyridoxamine 5'-phosphate oxidase family protein [Rhodopirellula sp.]|nr:pyridoxamine 5'-phosphate oxidase family protein [Rhodopirellula sp.]
MPPFPSDVAFTPAVKVIQKQKGSRAAYSRVEQGREWSTTVTPELREYLSSLDMFYLGTANASGQPYIQYRGGAPGFLKVMDERTLGFADFSGNRQYITLGNLSENPRAFIFLMDYVNGRRIKLWGTARVVENDPDLNDRLLDCEYGGNVERAIVFSIEAWDANCPQHIHKRFAQSVVAPIIEKLQMQVRELQAEIVQARRTQTVSSSGSVAPEESQ